MAIGLTSESMAYDELVAGPVLTKAVQCDVLATVSRGQVYQWDATGNNFVDYVSGSAANAYAICAERDDRTLSEDGEVICIVQGDVNKNGLNDVAELDPEIDAAMIQQGIRLLTVQGTAAAESS